MKKLLLIDDDVFLRDMYATKFGESDYEVLSAASAREGLKLLEQNTDVAVVLLDMVMPGMTGIELIKAIRQEFPDLPAKCIVLSNQGQKEDIDAATKAGAAGYIIKAEAVPSDVVKKVEEIIK